LLPENVSDPQEEKKTDEFGTKQLNQLNRIARLLQWLKKKKKATGTEFNAQVAELGITEYYLKDAKERWKKNKVVSIKTRGQGFTYHFLEK